MSNRLKLTKALRAINHPIRNGILAWLEEQKNGAFAGEIETHFGLKQSVTSMHLKVLRKSGFVDYVGDGRFHRYKVETYAIDHINELSEKWAEYEDCLGEATPQ